MLNEIKNTLKEEEKVRWKIIDKADWRVFLPIGLIVIILTFAGKIERGSWIYWIGIFCFALGAGKLATKFLFRKPTENLKSMSIVGDYNPSFFKRNMIAVFVLISILTLGFWAISLFN